MPQQGCAKDSAGIRRCVCITDGPLVADQRIALFAFPPGSGGIKGTVRVLQLDVTSQACPRGQYVWHLWAERPGECDLSPCVELLRKLAPTVAVNWCAYYTQRGGGDVDAWESAKGVWAVPPPSSEIDTGDAVEAAERLFRCA